MALSLLEKLLAFYNISYGEYLAMNRDVDLSNFANGHSFKDMDKAVSLVKQVIKDNGKILVYGDYDADGIMGTSILTKMFQYVDYINDYYLPSRYLDGYGITLDHAKEYVEKGYSLVITVDNGISAFEPIKYLHEHGVKVLVLDHHEMQDVLPEADVIIHPIISEFGKVSSSGAFTAFNFTIAFLNKTDKYLATLAAISLISDMMPLLEYNRLLLRAVIKDYKVGEFLSIDLLADHEQLDENIIGMKIAPRINSIGRLTEDISINKIVEYFVSDNKEVILNYYSHIVDTNELRKNLSKDTSESLSVNNNEKAIIICGEFKEGIIGLIANSVVNKYHKPTIVFTSSNNEELKGSARSPEGFNIVDAFGKLSDLLLTFGGHASAGGCSILKSNFEEFKKQFNILAESTEIVIPEHKCIDINISDICEENYELINSFSPFGECWPQPLFKIKHIKTSTLTFSRDEKHILTSFGYSLRLVGFNFTKPTVLSHDFIDLEGIIKKGFYRGNSYLEFNIKDLFDAKNN